MALTIPLRSMARASRTFLVADDGLERAQERRSYRAQLGAMRERELLQELFPAGRQSEEDFAAIRLAPRTSNQPSRFKAVAQFDRAVMTDLKALRKQSHCRLHVVSQSFDDEQRLMLVRLNARRPRPLLTEV